MTPGRLFLLSLSVGVSVLGVGVANADMEELNKIAAPSSYKNIFYSPTFDDFPSIEREFINSICSEELLSEFKLHEDEVGELFFCLFMQFNLTFTLPTCGSLTWCHGDTKHGMV